MTFQSILFEHSEDRMQPEPTGMPDCFVDLNLDQVVKAITHYRRREDASMESGKLDEELRRMSEIVETIRPNALLLLNESFAATNEREGSEIARQITRALVESHIKIFFVTHLYTFAHSLYTRHLHNALFLRAERQADGKRTFRVTEGEPLQTSYGEDLYRQIFRAGV